MKLKELNWGIAWFSPRIRFYPVGKEAIGEPKGSKVEFDQWRTPKSRDVNIDAAEIEALSEFISLGYVPISELYALE